ncbi:MAG: sel1 repeat family protein [Bacteroidales bacterium]|nr:sel1 repeat family protein [Bacteroidales bacterium]
MTLKTKKNIAGLLVLALLLWTLPCLAQDGKEEWRLAVDVLKGKDRTKDKSWAFGLLSDSQLEEKDAFVQNVLGIACLHGIGTAADTARAIACFEESGRLGYTLAWHNLGMYYKYAGNGRQDFAKACEAFARGAEAEDPSCCYDYAFMKYKGLGCRQDYAGAADLFYRASDMNHAPSVYMLGLCFRNGYGVEADTAIGNIYLRQAADLGYRDAVEELLNEMPENSRQYSYDEAEETAACPDRMPEITPYIPLDSRVMSGCYEGLLVTYDWSGEHVLSEKPLQVDMNVARDTATGVWIQGNDTVRFTAGIGDGGSFRFGGQEKDLYDRYSPDFISRYRFEQADLNYCRGYITGRLRLYSLDEMEPERPMYVSLHKTTLAEGEWEDEDGYAAIVAYSDPWSRRITLKFELPEAVPSARILICDRTGFAAGTYSYGAMDAGINTLTLSPDLRDGYYVIYVMAGTRKFQAVIVI